MYVDNRLLETCLKPEATQKISGVINELSDFIELYIKFLMYQITVLYKILVIRDCVTLNCYIDRSVKSL